MSISSLNQVARAMKKGGKKRIDSEKTEKPFWMKIIEMSENVPEDESRKLPADLAEKFEEYMYGAFRR